MTGTPIIEWLTTLKRAQRKRKVSFWGSDRFIQPPLVSTIFGDGGLILALIPLATRPRRYLIRLDNRTDLDSDEFYDQLDDIYEAIEDDFGPGEWEDDRGRMRKSYWPSSNFDCGTCWYVVTRFLDLRTKAKDED